VHGKALKVSTSLCDIAEEDWNRKRFEKAVKNDFINEVELSEAALTRTADA